LKKEKKNTLCGLVTDREHGNKPSLQNDKHSEIDEHSMRTVHPLTTERRGKGKEGKTQEWASLNHSQDGGEEERRRKKERKGG